MKLQVLPYVTVEIDDRLRRRLRAVGEHLRVTVRAYLRSAADDVDEAGDRVSGLCDRAVHRVDSVVAKVNDKIAPTATTATTAQPAPPHLRVVSGREAG
jgi:ribosome recycling factor